MLVCYDDGHVGFDQRLLKYLEKGQNDEAKSLLQNIRDFMHTYDSTGSKLLHYCARYGNTVMAKFMIEAGSYVNAIDNANCTPLMLAVQNADIPTVKILLKSNASVFTRDSIIKWTFQQCTNSIFKGQKYQLILKMLFEKVDEEFLLHKDATTSLLERSDIDKLAAVIFGNVELAEIMLRKGLSSNWQETKPGFTILHYAIIFGQVKNASLLIDHGADTAVMNNIGFTPLHFYTWNCELVDTDYNLLKRILRSDINFYLPNRYGHIEAEYLLKYGQKRTVKAILELGLEIVGKRDCYILGIHDDERINISKIAGLLFQHGASNDWDILERSAHMVMFQRGNTHSLKTVIADKLLKKSPISHYILNLIKTHAIFKTHFELCTKQLEEIKNTVVYGTVTLLMMLTQRQDKLVAYARNKDMVLAFKNLMRNVSDLEPYYFDALQRRMTDAMERAELENRIASVINKLTGLHDGAYRDVVFNIIGYLDQRDLFNLCRFEGLW